MEVIDFIEKDLKRSRPLWMRVLMSAIVLLLPIALGIFLRDDLGGVFDPRTFVPNTVAALLLGLVFLVALTRWGGRRAAWGLGFLGIAFAIFLASERVVFPVGLRTVYPSSDAFWRENLKCFTKGGVSTGIVGGWLVVCAFFASTWPTRRWRALFSALAGAAGAVMLGFHCDSSSLGHVLIAHWGQGAVLGGVVFVVQEALFFLGLKRALPGLIPKLRNLGRMG